MCQAWRDFCERFFFLFLIPKFGRVFPAQNSKSRPWAGKLTLYCGPCQLFQAQFEKLFYLPRRKTSLLVKIWNLRKQNKQITCGVAVILLQLRHFYSVSNNEVLPQNPHQLDQTTPKPSKLPAKPDQTTVPDQMKTKKKTHMRC